MTTYFTYGTLLKGHRNHGFLNGSEFLGTGILRKATMHNVGSFPAAIFSDDDNDRIAGELYNVTNPEIEKMLDRLEGVPRMYRKETVTIETETGSVKAYVYIWNNPIDGMEHIQSGDWSMFENKRQGIH